LFPMRILRIIKEQLPAWVLRHRPSYRQTAVAFKPEKRAIFPAWLPAPRPGEARQASAQRHDGTGQD